MKKILLALSLLLVFASPTWAKARIGIVFDAGGKNDRSFNQSAWEGAQRAQEALGIELKDAEPGDSSAVEEAMRAMASAGYDLIFGIGFANATAVDNVAREFPDIKFALVDAEVESPNIANLVFREHEGSYLVGILAAIRSRPVEGKRTIGFIGGMEIPLIHKFEQGYIQGAKDVYPNIEVIVNYVGNTPTAWNDPTKAKEIANSQIGKGASVIYHAAGGSGNGLFDAIQEHNGKGVPCYPKFKNKKRVDSCVYAIGVDSNQNYVVPGQILTSMLKRVDNAVYDAIEKVNAGTLKGGTIVYGLANDGVGFAIDEHNKRLITPKMLNFLNKLKQKIIDGKIVVKDKR